MWHRCLWCAALMGSPCNLIVLVKGKKQSVKGTLEWFEHTALQYPTIRDITITIGRLGNLGAPLSMESEY